jgi:hypothetical protein
MFIDIILKKKKKKTHSKSQCMSIANHIYVFNNTAYTTKTTPLIFKNKIKMKKTMFIDIVLKKKNSECYL